jgi:predicted ATPase
MRIHEALTLAHELSHPFSLAFALGIRSWLSQLQGEPQRAQEQAERLMALSSEQGFPLRAASGMIQRGWALAGQGQGEEGVAQIRQGLAAWRAMGTRLAQVMVLAWLAEAYGKAGQVEEGLAVLAEALPLVEKTEERVCEAELYRLYGDLSLRSGEMETAEEESENRGRGEAETTRRESLFSSPVPRFCLRLHDSPFLPQKTPSSRPLKLHKSSKPNRSNYER